MQWYIVHDMSFFCKINAPGILWKLVGMWEYVGEFFTITIILGLILFGNVSKLRQCRHGDSTLKRDHYHC